MSSRTFSVARGCLYLTRLLWAIWYVINYNSYSCGCFKSFSSRFFSFQQLCFCLFALDPEEINQTLSTMKSPVLIKTIQIFDVMITWMLVEFDTKMLLPEQLFEPPLPCVQLLLLPSFLSGLVSNVD